MGKKIYGATVGGGGLNLRKIPQSDWSQTNETQMDYIKNKPTVKKGITEGSIVLGENAMAGAKSIYVENVYSGFYTGEHNGEAGELYLYFEVDPDFEWSDDYCLQTFAIQLNGSYLYEYTYEGTDAFNNVCDITVSWWFYEYAYYEDIDKYLIEVQLGWDHTMSTYHHPIPIGEPITITCIPSLECDDVTQTGAVAFAGGTHAGLVYDESGNPITDVNDSAYSEQDKTPKTLAVGMGSFAHGWNTLALGDQSHAEGRYAEALGIMSHAEGSNTKAVGNNSHAEGRNTIATKMASHAEGFGTQTYRDYQHVSGKYNKVLDEDDGALFIVGCGTSEANRSNALTVYEDGTVTTGRWSNKKWLCVGDSITFGSGYHADTYYYDIISQQTGIKFTQNGCSGTGYLDDITDDVYLRNGSFADRLGKMVEGTDIVLSEYDVVTLFGSGTDVGALAEAAQYNLSNLSTLLGEVEHNREGTDISDIPSNISDISETGTLYGRINAAINRIYNSNPKCQVAIITPTPWDLEPGRLESSSKYWAEYVNALITLCQYRGIPCLDLFHNSGLQPQLERSAESRTLYSDDDDYNDNGQRAVHLSNEGQAFIAPRIKALLETLIL